jgi:hypothetical protein
VYSCLVLPSIRITFLSPPSGAEGMSWQGLSRTDPRRALAALPPRGLPIATGAPRTPGTPKHVVASRRASRAGLILPGYKAVYVAGPSSLRAFKGSLNTTAASSVHYCQCTISCPPPRFSTQLRASTTRNKNSRRSGADHGLCSRLEQQRCARMAQTRPRFIVKRQPSIHCIPWLPRKSPDIKNTGP